MSEVESKAEPAAALGVSEAKLEKTSSVLGARNLEEGDDGVYEGNVLITKKRRVEINHRAWSVQPDENAPTKVVTITAYYGDPRSGGMPGSNSRMLATKKEHIQSYMRSTGYFTEDQLKGTKDVLRERIRTTLPFVTFEIDSREPLQRVLVVALSKFEYDDTHCFSASMPRRGDHPLGVRSYKSCDDLVDMRMFTEARSGAPSPFRCEEEREDYIARKIRQGCSVDTDTLRGLITGKIKWDGLTAIRKVQGTAFTPNNSFEGDPILTEEVDENDWARGDMQKSVKLKSGGAMSLDDTDLVAGDFIKFSYDFGDNHLITMKIVKVTESSPLLPEADFGSHNTRAKVVNKSTFNPRSQYRSGWGNDGDGDHEDEDDDDEY